MLTNNIVKIKSMYRSLKCRKVTSLSSLFILILHFKLCSITRISDAILPHAISIAMTTEKWVYCS